MASVSVAASLPASPDKPWDASSDPPASRSG